MRESEDLQQRGDDSVGNRADARRGSDRGVAPVCPRVERGGEVGRRWRCPGQRVQECVRERGGDQAAPDTGRHVTRTRRRTRACTPRRQGGPPLRAASTLAAARDRASSTNAARAVAARSVRRSKRPGWRSAAARRACRASTARAIACSRRLSSTALARISSAIWVSLSPCARSISAVRRASRASRDTRAHPGVEGPRVACASSGTSDSHSRRPFPSANVSRQTQNRRRSIRARPRRTQMAGRRDVTASLSISARAQCSRSASA